MRSSRDNTMLPLTDIRNGHLVQVCEVLAGRRLRARLNAMGLFEGTPLTVISMNGGTVIVDVKGTRLMLGRGMARKVLVRSL
jgi:Fe2+ transport system protein FeoA